MKILIVGGNGTIGKVVVDRLQGKHEIVVAGRSSGQIKMDMEVEESIARMYKEVGKIDALVCIAGDAAWGEFSTLTEKDFYTGIKSKLMGQVNLVRLGQRVVSEGGSFTLTTGILAEDPVTGAAVPAMVNGALHSFVLAASREMRNHRINVVAAGLVEDAREKYESYFPGHMPVSMDSVAAAYQRSVEGNMSGEILRVY